MLHGVFVTGTDTGIGKTVVCAAIMHRYRGADLRYWKPIQTGIDQDDDTATVRHLGGCGDDEVWDEGVRLPRPLSPHLAARLKGERIDLRSLTARVQDLPSSVRWVAEGAGGVLVPINEQETMADLMQLLGLPVLVVARTGLGTINHTLLTIEALRSRSLTVAGVLMAGAPNPENREAIETYGGVPVIGELPILDPLTPDSLARTAMNLDPQNVLARSLA